jgi:uncharacterized membrane protein
MIDGLEIHPSIVHFPIALTIVGALAVLAYALLRRDWLRWFGPILLTIALAGAGGAYFSGKSAEDRAEHIGVPEAAIEEHEEVAIWAIWVIGLSALLAWATHASRRGVWLAGIVSLAAVTLVALAAHRGGKLVYIHGAGHVPSASAPKAGASPAGATGGAPAADTH